MLVIAGTVVNLNIELVGPLAGLCVQVNDAICSMVASPIRFGAEQPMSPHITLALGPLDTDVRADDLAVCAAGSVTHLRGTEIELGSPHLEDRDHRYLFLAAAPVELLRQAQDATREALAASGLMTRGHSGSDPHATVGYVPEDALDRSAEVVAALAAFAEPARGPLTHVRVSVGGRLGTCGETLARTAI